MTWKQRRLNTILACIAAVLFAVLLILFGARYREGRDATQTADGMGASVFTGKNGETPAYTALRYTNGTASLSFALDESGKWTWEDDPEYPLDDAVLLQMIDALSGLHFQQTLDATESMESYGLSDPAATLSVTDGQGVTRTLAFGKATTDGNSRYLQMNGDESTVYIVADGLYQLMQTPIYSMCALPELPDLSAPLGLTIQGPAPAAELDENGVPLEAPEPLTTVLTARRSDGGDAATLWFRGNDNVTSNAQLAALLEDVRTMYLARCLDYRPSDEAAEICGFDRPAAVLTVTYGASGSEQTLTLTVGAAMESDRCVRLDDSETIYLLSAEYLDALLQVAAGGLEGA